MNATPTVWLDGGWSTNVLPSAVGIEVDGGEMLTVLKRGTALPATNSCRVTTTADYQTAGDVRVFYGDRRKTERNTLVGEAPLRGISPLKKGDVSIRLGLTVDVDGQVTLRAKEVNSDKAWKDRVFRQRIGLRK